MFETFQILSSVLLGKIDGLKTRDERGSVTLEQAIVTGLLSILAVALLAAIGVAVVAAQNRITT
ncbi:hypothetical protein H5397_09245 [Propioniciclava sp. MC1683]|jgi:hypothetical protein|uniref:hypothetical protein n=1 Tax=Propioniciclava sp. MC1683 TaxID=2760309 RepID=UPI0016046431|nr:hypothetical protein [Propioniciclava sp. MC1683]MBB1501610.1 hypothetical protein [Propioniciclava sp. MC1683]